MCNNEAIADNPEDVQFTIDPATKEDYGCQITYTVKDGVIYVLDVVRMK